MKQIKVSAIHGDALLIEADTLILKYAQGAHGLDKVIIDKFQLAGHSINRQLPEIGKYYFLDSKNFTKTKNILFIGTQYLSDMGYGEIREFARTSLISLAKVAPNTKTISMTIHGPGMGLDEIEAFESLITGLLDSITFNEFPASLEHIIFVDRGKYRAEILHKVLHRLFPDGTISVPEVDEKFITKGQVDNHQQGSNNTGKIFFSYARSDSEFALKLAEDVRLAGFKIWIDQLDIKTGDRWAREVEKALHSCGIFLVILSKISLESDNVHDEITVAIEEKKRIIPILIPEGKVPLRIRSLHYIDFTMNYEKGLKKLCEALNSLSR